MFLRNNKGISMVYVMISLIIIGLTATALIKLSHKNAITQINYSNSESARLAVHSGFEKALSFFESDQQDTILAILRKWYKTEDPSTINGNYRWVVGNENRFDSIYSDCKFKVQILGFDTSSFSISLHSEGLTQTGNKASAVGTYYLDGLSFGVDADSGVFPTNALHLGQGAGEMVSTLKVMRGDTYIDNPKSFFTSPGDPHEFHGIFMTTSQGSNSDNFYIKDCIFHDQAYISSKTTVQNGTIVCKKGIGFENDVLSSGNFEIYGNHVIMNGNYTGDGGTNEAGFHFKESFDIIGWNSKTYKTTSASTIGGIATGEASTDLLVDSITDIKSRLSITKKEPPEISVDVSVIPDSLIHNCRSYFGGYTVPDAEDINDAYDDLPLWNDFLVMKGRTLGYSAFGHDDTLDCKVIWIMDNESDLYAPYNAMFEMSDSALFMLYLDNTAMRDFRLPKNFRGFIYSDGHTSATPKHILFGHNNEVHGGILIKDRTFRLQDAGGTFDVYYDSTVINAFASLGLFVLEGDVDTTELEKELVFERDQLESELLSRSF